MKNLLFQIDGKLPNYALMRLSTWLRNRGEEVTFSNSLTDCPAGFNRAFASSIFDTSFARRAVFSRLYPNAIVGGDGYFPVWRTLTIIGKNMGSNLREVIADTDPEQLEPDYSLYPRFLPSIGYSQRGCRLDCGFCRMKTREGDARSVRGIHKIWRGKEFPKHIFLLDNDFFGQEEGAWREFLETAAREKFKICFNQGINVRLINAAQADLLSKVFYSDDKFSRRRLYTAWDSLHDEKIFKEKILMLHDAGIPPHKIMVYMLIAWDAKAKGGDSRPWNEQEPEIFHRYNELIKLGCKPYPMVFDATNKPARIFQRWVIRRYAQVCSWEEFDDWKRFKRDNPI